jgi:amidase
VTTTRPLPDGGFVAAATRTPDRLRIAFSTKSPLGPAARVGRAQQAALIEAVALLRLLGHDVVEHRPDYAAVSAGWNVTARYLRGIYDDVKSMPRPELLEARTRSMARAGSRISDGRIDKVRAGEAALTKRVNAMFEHAEVILTPGTATGPPRVGAFTKRGAFITASATMGRSPFQAIFNATGQPAAVVPWGLDRTGLPTSVQLVGRPSDEATLLALSAQIEEVHPWAGRRPPIS